MAYESPSSRKFSFKRVYFQPNISFSPKICLLWPCVRIELCIRKPWVKKWIKRSFLYIVKISTKLFENNLHSLSIKFQKGLISAKYDLFFQLMMHLFWPCRWMKLGIRMPQNKNWLREVFSWTFKWSNKATGMQLTFSL